MRKFKKIKLCNDLRLTKKEKFKVNGCEVRGIVWHKESQKIFFGYDQSSNPLIMLDLKTGETSTPINLDFFICQMKLTKCRKKLILLSQRKGLYVVELKTFKIEKTIKLVGRDN